MAKERLTLTIDPELIQQMKIHAVLNKTSVSKVTEELWRKHLKETEKKQ